MLLSIAMLRRALFLPAAAAGRSASEPSVRIEKIVAEHVDRVWRTARDLGVPHRDLEDVVQEVLLVVVRRLGDIDVDRERAFVVATTARVSANWRRTRRRRPEELTDFMDTVPTSSDGFSGQHFSGQSFSGESFSGSSGPRGPEQALERMQKLELLATALGEMPEAQRVAFTLFELEQLTAKEIAERLGIAQSAVFARVRRAWVVFRRCCERSQVGETQSPRRVSTNVEKVPNAEMAVAAVREEEVEAGAERRG